MEAGAPEVQVKELAQVVDLLGTGWAQLSICAVAGGVWLADGSELMVISSVTRQVKDEWNLSPMTEGSIVSVVFFGVMVGNMFSGMLGDYLGRRRPILLSYLLLGVLSLVSALSPNVWFLGGVRFLVGASMGLGQPTCMSLVSESSPTHWRLVISGIGQLFFSIGEIYSVVFLMIQDPQLKHLDWRTLLCIGAIPAFIWLAVAYFFLWESPSFLAMRGDEDDAVEVLRRMRQLNRRDGDVGDDELRPFRVGDKHQVTAKESLSNQFRHVCGGGQAFVTALVSFGCFTLNFTLYGGLYAFPQVLPQVSEGVAPAVTLLIGVLWEFPGAFLGIICGFWLPRKISLVAAFTGMAVSSVCFAHYGGLSQEESSGFTEAMFYVGYFGLKGFPEMCFIILYQYSVEVYTTSSRAMGSACCLAAGRFGAMSCSLAFELMQSHLGSWRPFFYILSVFSALNCIGLTFCPETKDVLLPEDYGETSPLVAGKQRAKV